MLVEKGFTKLLGQFDDMESSREGAGMRDTKGTAVREVLEAVGLDGDIAQYNEMSGLSGGQKVKVVIAAAMFNRYVEKLCTMLIYRPQCLFLDEPTNFLDREALGGLAVAIKEWGGAVCIISHSTEFVTALCPELWHVDNGELTHKGKVALVEDAFDDPSRPSSRTTSKAGTPRTGAGTPIPGTPGLRSGATSAVTSAANSGAEDVIDGVARLGLKPKKKKMTRNEMKAQEERRRLRKLNWLTYGGEWIVNGKIKVVVVC